MNFLPLTDDHVAGKELSPASRLDDAVHQHFAALDQQLGLAPGLDALRELEELIEADRIVGVGGHAGATQRPRTVATARGLNKMTSRRSLD